MFDI